ncbi:hypothetical protein [Streptomyces sp. NPDC059455]|uniref:hypothetical protein n=1 Tax=Streptomyces sp. NPDC059455 TaxID=3346837 RepID=UPI0036B88754
MLNPLFGLEEQLGMSYLFICHDMAIVRHFADRVAVMRKGRITGEAPAPVSYDLMKPST